jgi:hypothetical protein
MQFHGLHRMSLQLATLGARFDVFAADQPYRTLTSVGLTNISCVIKVELVFSDKNELKNMG